MSTTALAIKRFKRYGSLLPKAVSVVNHENQGASAARNQAFELCQGDYIQWLDADDLIAPDKIAKQIEALSWHIPIRL